MSDYDAAFSAALGSSQQESNPYDGIFKDSMPKTPKVYEPDPVAPVNDFSGTLRFGPLDTGIQLPESVNRRLAQFGSGIADLTQGVQQRFGIATEADTAEKRKLDASLNNDTGGKALAFAGKVAPWLAAPGGGIAGAAATGLAQGFLEPTVKGDSVGFNTVLGGGLGAAIPGAVAAFRTMSKPADELAAKAVNQYGIPLTVADISASKPIKAVKSILDSLPVTGSIGAAQNEARQAGFNRAVSKTIGADAEKLTPDVLAQAKTDIGGKLNQIWNNNSLTVDGQFIQDLQKVGQRASSLNPEQQAMVNKQIQNLLSKIDQNGNIPGNFTNNWQSELRLLAEGDKGLAQSVLSDLRKSALSAFNRSVTGGDAKALGQARTQYGALKTLEPLMNKAEAGVAGRVSGDVPAALLPQAVAQQYGTRVASSPFADLAPIAGRFMVDRTPQTGGSLRALMQNGALAGAAGAGAMYSPMATLGTTLGTIGAGSLAQVGLGPTVARAMLQQKAARGLLDAPQFSKALQDAGYNAMKSMPYAAGMGLLTLPALE